MSEHLFRDEQGAALERAVRLEAENAQLRAQLVHERTARQAQTVRTRTGSPALVIAFVAFGIVVGLAALGAGAALLLFRPAPPPRSIAATASPPPGVPAQPRVAPAPLTSDPVAVPGDRPFDRGAAAAALGSVDVQGCKAPDGPTGNGHVKVTFAPTGKVASTLVDMAPYAGTAVGACVEARFQLVQIPPFAGSSVVVGKSFTVD